MQSLVQESNQINSAKEPQLDTHEEANSKDHSSFCAIVQIAPV